MKKLLLSITLCSLFVSVSAQQGVKRCHTDEAMNEWFSQNPAAKTEFLNRQQEAAAQDAADFKNGYGMQSKTAATNYTIPVVFHVIHTGGSENITDAQIMDQIMILNRDFSKLNADTAVVVPQFKNLIGDAKISFSLATKDPSGNCTNGITRHYDTRTDWMKLSTDFFITWPASKYLNIYVVKTISGGTAAAYTYLPGTSPTAAMDCVVSLYDYVGSIGQSNLNNSRTITHEVGHWLNLSHVWGNTNNAGVACGDDGVTDTPITKGNLSCPSGTAAAIVCTPGIVENYQNYMDYSYCDVMFTIGQCSRMTTAINSAIGSRNNLSTVGNLTATGIISPISPCAPISAFYSSNGLATGFYTVCAGQSINFIDNSYNAAITSRSWTTNGGGIAATPTASTCSISFPTSGTWTVTNTVGNGTGSNSSFKTITVLTGVANYTNTYQEGFEPVGLPANWTIINQTGGTTWQQYFGAAATGNGSYYMQNTVNPNGAVDILETPSYDFLNNTGAKFTFKYAYAQYNTTWADVFKVQASSNCGGTWSDIYVPSAATLAGGSGGVTTTPLIPTTGQYKTYTLTSHPAFNVFKSQPNVRIRFYFKEDPASGFGNNFWLDDINFNSPLGVNELTKSLEFSLYPNPTEASATIAFTLSDNADIKFNVLDVTGRVVEQDRKYSLAPGKHNFVVNESLKLKSGIYIVNFEMNGQKIAKKLIIE